VKRSLPLALAAALVVLSLVESVTGLTATARVATDGDWRAAAAEVRGGFQPGDLIVFAPAWVAPIGRTYLGDLIPVEMAARADADRYGRVWEVAIRGAHAPEARSAEAVHTNQHGRVAVALYRKQAAEPVYDFTAHASEAHVSAGGRGCLPGGDPPGFACAGARVEPRTLEADFRPHRGILTPASAAGPVAVVFEAVPLGRTLVGYTAIHDYYARKNSDAPVDFRVLIDGRERLRVRARNEDGWRRFELDTAAEQGSPHSVSFEVSAGNPAWRSFGFHAEARK
jgi:hypothetical protein